MPSLLNEALEWLDRAEQAREVASQLIDRSAKRAVLDLADSFERLARAAASPTVVADGTWRGNAGDRVFGAARPRATRSGSGLPTNAIVY